MHSAKALFAALLFTLMILLNAPVMVRADDEDADADEYDVTARVVRTSLLEGEVNLRRAGNKSWERATLNLPLVEGDTLATAAGARLEIQIDARNFVRVGADSILRIVTLREGGIVLSLVEGTATLRLARFDRKQEYFEVDAPKTTIAAEKPGLYRLDVARGGDHLRLTAREGGRARIYSDTSGFTLRDGRTAELVYNNSDEGDWQLSTAPSFDSWDTWVDDRERYLAARLRYDERDRYYDADIWGAEELDAYGDWVYTSDYGGWVWRPHVTVINNYYNWTPYRHGHWRWCPPYGWTWVGDEPWGWAPYHYGRWVYYNNNWCWAPRGYGDLRARNWWRPALVAFVYVPSSYGEHVAWYPLGYGQHDPYRSNHPRRTDRLTPLRARERESLRRINPATMRAVTSVPAREFGNEAARVQPANADIARRAVTTEPVRARLPIAPADSDQNRANERDRQTRGRNPARPAPTIPAALEERPTGAAARSPGVPLDDELRRSRLFNGRAPRAAAPAAEESGAAPADQSTGAVARPVRPARRQPIEGDTDRDRNFRNNIPSPARSARPARPSTRDEERPRPASPDESVAPERRAERPTRAPRVEPSSPPEEAPPSENPAPTERPSSPPPARPERHAPVERDMPVARPARPQERQEPPPPQPEMRPEPSRREPPAPRREEPPTPPAEPARREETPTPPPPSSPPPREEPQPQQRAPEPEREREAPPQHDRLPERDRDRPPLN